MSGTAHLLAQLEPQEPSQPIVGAALVALAISWGLVALAWAATRPRRPRPAPSTMELGSEPPAIVDLLTDDFEVTPEAVPATLLDLAARRWIAIEEVAPDRPICRLRTREGEGVLLPFERQVLDHVRSLAVEGEVPTAALTTGPEAVSARWWRRFRAAVVTDARDRGLSRPRWPAVLRLAAWIGPVVVGGLLWLSTAGVSDAETFDPTAGFVLGVAGTLPLVAASTAISISRRERDTAAGLEAAGRWMGVRAYLADHGRFAEAPAAAVAVWDRYLAYATALDLADRAVAELPLGAEDDRHAWSAHGGRWRPIRVRYLVARPGWGAHPAWAALTGLLAVAAFGYLAVVGFGVAGDAREPLERVLVESELVEEVSDAAVVWAGRVALAVTVLCALAVAWGLARLVNGAAGMLGWRTIEGTVVRARERGGPGATLHGTEQLPFMSVVARPRRSGRRRANGTPRRYLAVDDGTTDRIDAWRVRPQIYAAVSQGQHVTARVAPAVGYVRTIHPADPDAARAERPNEHSLVAPAAELAADPSHDPAAGALARAARALASSHGAAGTESPGPT